MTISSLYRPALTTLTGYRVEVDGWSAGMPGADSGELARGVVDAQGTCWYLTNLDGWQSAPPPRNSLAPRPGAHGGYDGQSWLDMRAVTIEGYAVATDRVSTWRARDIVSSVCGDPAAGLVQLTVMQAGYLNLIATVRRSGDVKTTPLAPNTFKWSMILVAPDPRRYAAQLSSQSTGLPVVGTGGLAFPAAFPLTFGAGRLGGQMTVTNGGTMETRPVWVITGPVAGATITNDSTGDVLQFDPSFSLAAGQQITVDTDVRTASLGGVSCRNRLVSAEWFGFPPGDTSVRFGSTSGADPAALLTAQWRDAWV
jgi:hypothetical protein